MFDLVRALNTSIDAGEMGTGDVPAITAAFDHFDSVLGVLSLRRAEDERPPIPLAEIERLIDGAQGRAPPPRLCRSADRIREGAARSKSAASCSKTAARHALEAEIDARPSQSTDKIAMTLPLIKTPLPGPKAKAIIERDGEGRLSVVHARLSVRHGARRGARSSKTSTATCSSTAPPASPSTRPAIPILTSSPRSSIRRRSSCTCRERISITSRRCGSARRSTAIAPLRGPKRSFFSNSGTEAIEAAIKLARYHTKRYGIIAFLGSFHGRTLGSLSLTSSKAIQRRGFGPPLPGTYHAPYRESAIAVRSA